MLSFLSFFSGLALGLAMGLPLCLFLVDLVNARELQREEKYLDSLLKELEGLDEE